MRGKGGHALVIGATEFEPEEVARIGEASRRVPIVRSGNFSIGVNMLVGLVAKSQAHSRPMLGI